ncbi:Uncharacterised protein [uncultured archaeon]|nr:Uncharacterised protein [uncultured archaeon]
MNVDLVTVDTNIRRIFIAEFHLSEDVSTPELWEYAGRFFPVGRSREWHDALMDLWCVTSDDKENWDALCSSAVAVRRI